MNSGWIHWVAAWAALCALVLGGAASAKGPCALPPGAQPGEQRTVELPGGADMTLIWIPADELILREPPVKVEDEFDGLEGSWGDEEETEPQESLGMSMDGFWIGVCEVTQKQWVSVMGDNPSYFRGEELPTASLRANLPVECVSWNDCMEFCRRTGFRLPTEMEWNRAQNTWVWPDGSWSWTSKNSENRTHPVGRSKAGRTMLFDMDGNVCEWCADWFGPWPETSRTNYTGALDGTERVICGGCWCGDEYFDQQRWKNRLSLPPECRYNSVGFRVCLSPTDGRD